MGRLKVSHNNPAWTFFFVLLAILLAIFTQFYCLTEVPGFHFDEAWQGLYAHRIVSEPQFWPFHAMNQYTVAIVHYLLAFSFKILGSTFLNMRMAIGIVNLLTMLLFVRLVAKVHSWSTAAFFMVFWAMMPMMIHDHRFYVEMTYWFGFCFALCVTGLTIKNQIMKKMFIVFGLTLGVLSHVLFTIVPISYGLISLRHRLLTAFEKICSILIATWLFYIYLGTQKLSALALSLFFVFLSLCPGSLVKKLQTFRAHIPTHALFYVCIPYLLFFLLLIWDGRWSYAQATGILNPFWLPINSTLTMFLFLSAFRTKEKWVDYFLIIFAINSLFLIKPAPRFYMMPAIILCYGLSIEIKKQTKIVQIIAAIVIVVWNSWSFHDAYINDFQNNGGSNEGFHWLWFKDSNRDFRPFQKVFIWLKKNKCGLTIREVEDDRFLRPIEFLQIELAQDNTYEEHCPWPKNDLLFTHCPNLTLKNHTQLVQEKNWGDLCLALRTNPAN